MASEHKVVLVIDADPSHNWYKVFKDVPNIRVEQTSWDLIDVNVNEKGTPVVDIKPSPEPILGTNQKNERCITPDVALIRNFVLGIHGKSHLNSLLGLGVGNVPCINSFQSILLSTQRAAFIAELRRIEKKQGPENFPLIPMRYYSNNENHMVVKEDQFPLVAKVGTSHAGYGKMVFHDSSFQDFSTVMAMYQDYVTLEPFVKGRVADIRIQQIGNHIRAYKRVNLSTWKGNVGLSEVQDIEVTDTYRLWMKECSQIFGGLDICSLDAVIDEKGNHTILEVNDTATGLNPNHEAEDTLHIKQLVLDKLSLKNEN
mmetsp:Transcript_14997/g.20976  ORF Transcript_14997/g.20976 Transcript_14997/m.20976 type:complete len:314 (-) Transcript_14997:18-959(-)